MKILLVSYAFRPSIGGIETVSQFLYEQLTRLGHEVKVVTNVVAQDPSDDDPFVYRRPRIWQLLSLYRWCDVCLHNNVSIRYGWPLFFIRKPLCIVIGGATGIDLNRRSVASRLKLNLLRRSKRVAVSRYIGEAIGMPCTVIPNAVSSPFSIEFSEDRHGVAFLGRLVAEKGVDVLLRAMALIPVDSGISCTVIGEGSERSGLERLATELGISDRVTFLGALRGDELWHTLSRHLVLAVPSQYEEPFGVVVLEGMACGCTVLASKRGGLPEAVGDAGRLVPSDDVQEWAAAILDIHRNPGLRMDLNQRAGRHLEAFRPEVVAAKYQGVLQSAVDDFRQA